jgi:hypothetical protein
MPSYKEGLVTRFWDYQIKRFPNWETFFEKPKMPDTRPPVFLKQKADFNVICTSGISEVKRKELLAEIPVGERHRWFRSMTSSQALAQSVFGNLKIYDHLEILNELTDEKGEPLFMNVNFGARNISMEHHVDFLREPRSTSIDLFVAGDHQVAIECKLSESEVGSCSRPRLTKRDSNFGNDYCDGTFTYQRDRRERCTLTNIGVLYWDFIPSIFHWKNDTDHNPCPLRFNYQLVRNILAACISPHGELSTKRGHVVLVYDDRNPSFQKGGKGFVSFEATKRALKYPKLLRKCSWQRIIKLLRKEPDLDWLTQELNLKYGL